LQAAHKVQKNYVKIFVLNSEAEQQQTLDEQRSNSTVQLRTAMPKSVPAERERVNERAQRVGGVHFRSKMNTNVARHQMCTSERV